MTVTVVTLPTPPTQSDPASFDTRADAFLAVLPTFGSQLNAQNAENNTINSNVNLQSQLTATASAAAVAAANFKGNWSSLTGILNIPASVFHNGKLWQLTANLSNVTTAEPGISSSWYPIVNTDIATRASIQPTLDLDFANQRYRVFDTALGLKEIALADVLTYTGSGRTYTDALGILRAQASNVPRIEFDPVTGAGNGFSMWPARTNLFTYSEQFDNAIWLKTRATVTANTTTAPDGTTTADKLVEDTTAASTHYIRQVTSVTSGLTYTMSVWLKPAGRNHAMLSAAASGTSFYAYFDLSLGTVGLAVGAGLTAACSKRADGWCYCTMTVTATATETANNNIWCASTATAGGNAYTGDGASGIHVWGAQFEQAVSASPYIPTTTAAVTAPADIASITSSNFSKWFNPFVGVFVMLLKNDEVMSTSGQSMFSADDGTTTNRISSVLSSGNSAQVAASAGGTQSGLVSTNFFPTLGVTYAVAVAYASNDLTVSINGGAVTTDLSVDLPAAGVIDRLRIGLNLRGNIHRILYFPRRLTNAELQALSA